MIIQHLTLENFCQFREITLTFPASRGKPLTIIHGNNGFGKNNLLAALSIALRGFPDDPEKFRRFLPRHPADSAVLPCSVRMGFLIPQAGEFKIERHLLLPPGHPAPVTRSSRLGTTL